MESPIEKQKNTQEKILRWDTLFLTLPNQSSMVYVKYLIDSDLFQLNLLPIFLRAL